MTEIFIHKGPLEIWLQCAVRMLIGKILVPAGTEAWRCAMRRCEGGRRNCPNPMELMGMKTANGLEESSFLLPRQCFGLRWGQETTTTWSHDHTVVQPDVNRDRAS